MKKIKTLVAMIGGLLLAASCANDNDLEVYLYHDNSELRKIVPTGAAPVYYSDGKLKGVYGYVDLGLSVKWANFSLGCKADTTTLGLPNEISYEEFRKNYNNYLQKNEFESLTSRYYYHWAGIDSYAVKDDYKDLPMNIAGTEYDNATTELGSDWRMPTKAELQELIDKCTWKYYEHENVRGYIVTGPSGKSIFLHLAGATLLNDDPHILLSSERTTTWNKGVEVYALDISNQKMVSNHPSGRYATIRPVYIK